MVTHICENVTVDYAQDFKFNSAIIKENSWYQICKQNSGFSTIHDIDKITNKKELDKISKKLFEYENAKSDPEYPKSGDPF